MREVVALYKIEISYFCMKQRIKDADYICVAKNTSKHTNFNSIYSCHFSLINFFINNEQTSIRPMTNRQSSTRPISISINVFTTQAITSTYLHSINNLNIFTGYNKLCLRGGGGTTLYAPLRESLVWQTYTKFFRFMKILNNNRDSNSHYTIMYDALNQITVII